jgi:hypothetical protein
MVKLSPLLLVVVEDDGQGRENLIERGELRGRSGASVMLLAMMFPSSVQLGQANLTRMLVSRRARSLWVSFPRYSFDQYHQSQNHTIRDQEGASMSILRGCTLHP